MYSYINVDVLVNEYLLLLYDTFQIGVYSTKLIEDQTCTLLMLFLMSFKLPFIT